MKANKPKHGRGSLVAAALLMAGGFAAPLPAARAESGGGPVVADEASFSGRLQPQNELVILVRPAAEAVDLLTLPTSPLLSDTATRAVARAPRWLRDRLAHRLGLYPFPVQDALSDLILGAADPRHTDEIAFTVATVPPEEVLRDEFDPSILSLNAELVYEAAAALDYVELIEVGSADVDEDYHTTIRYAMLDVEGRKYWSELPRDAYYWYVVHPRLSAEPLLFADPTTGEPAPRGEGGVFWREYFLREDVPPHARASLHFVTEHPYLITDADLADWGYSARTVLTGFEVDPIPLIVDVSSGWAVLAVFAYPGRTNDGAVLATTLPVEQAYEHGNPELLENLLLAGNASAHLPAGSRVAVLKDRDPFGVPTVEHALTALGFVFDVYGSADLPSLDATALGAYKKVVVPSGQQRTFYEQLAAHAERIRAYCSMDPDSRDVVYEFHGATDDATVADHWDDLVMPGGLTAAVMQGGPADRFAVTGYPKLMDVMAGTEVFWDATAQRLGGNDPLPAEAQALIRLGYFGTQNTPDRCSEMPSYYNGPDGLHTCVGPCSTLVQALRSAYPQRILYLHYGNCGEMQAVLGAAARSALAPVADVDARADDHVWNEFFNEGRWVNYSIYRSDASTVVDYAGLVHDGWAAVMALRGDGYAENATRRYTPTVTLDLTVTDLHGRPVDGATLMLASEYNKQVGETVPLWPLMLAWTDRDGRASVELGLNRNYYVQVKSPLGYLPGPDDGYVMQITCENTSPGCPGTDEQGKVIELSFAYETALAPPPSAQSTDVPAQTDMEGPHVSITVTAGQQILESVNPLQRDTFEKHLGPGEVDVTVLDSTGFANYIGRQPYTAKAEHLQTPAIDLSIPAPESNGDLYVVVSNKRRSGLSQQIQATVTLLKPPPLLPDEKDPRTPGCGCGTPTRAGSTDSPTVPPVLLFLAALALTPGLFRTRPRSHRK